jgi:hypothetical protein
MGDWALGAPSFRDDMGYHGYFMVVNGIESLGRAEMPSFSVAMLPPFINY